LQQQRGCTCGGCEEEGVQVGLWKLSCSSPCVNQNKSIFTSLYIEFFCKILVKNKGKQKNFTGSSCSKEVGELVFFTAAYKWFSNRFLE